MKSMSTPQSAHNARPSYKVRELASNSKTYFFDSDVVFAPFFLSVLGFMPFLSFF